MMVTVAMFVPAFAIVVTFALIFVVAVATVVVEMGGNVRIDIWIHILVMDCGFEDYGRAVDRNQEKIRAFGRYEHSFAGLEYEVRGLVENLQLD